MMAVSSGERTKRMIRPTIACPIHLRAIDIFTVTAFWITAVSEARRFTSSPLCTLS